MSTTGIVPAHKSRTMCGSPERHGYSVSCQLEDWTGSEANQGPDPPA